MSEVKFVLRDATRDISSTWHGSCADRAVAALSADPVTIEELEIALERFMKPSHGGFFLGFPRGLDDKPWDAGLVVIDLSARLVVVQSTYSSPTKSGSVWYHNGQCCTDIQIRYDLADEWMFSRERDNWRSLARSRRRERAEGAPLDARAILFGRPLIEFLATECFAVFPRREVIAQAVRVKWAEAKRARACGANRDGDSTALTILASDSSLTHVEVESMCDDDLAPKTRPGQERYASPFYDTLKEIHARWLMTPREDLRGEIPREVLLAEHEHRMCDMQHRCDQWSRTQECPRGLDEMSHAFRFGGFGTHELVKYYDLVRELLWSCWDQLTELAQSPNLSRRPVSLALGDFLTTEVPRLEQFRDQWLDTPDPEFEFQTPRSIIDRERARIPEAVSGHDAMIDPDCPCCQMLADLPGPMFWHLDGSGMDWEYPFDIYHRTREEWDEEQGQNDEFDRQFSAEQAERKRLGVEDASSGTDESNAIWSHSFSVADTPDMPLGIRLFGMGGHLAELIVDLRELGNAQTIIDQLNRDFGNLREVLSGADGKLASALIDPVLTRFTETLELIAVLCSDLKPKCSDLSRQLQGFLEPPDRDTSVEFPDDGFSSGS